MANRVVCGLAVLLCLVAAGSPAPRVGEWTLIPGRPTDTSIALSVLAPEQGSVSVEYGTRSGVYEERTKPVATAAGEPREIELTGLRRDTRYFGRIGTREFQFHTQRAPGSGFSFGVQGDSHPERRNSMFDPELYRRTVRNAASDGLDFYITLGDDFNVDQLFNRGELNEDTVSQLYINQRSFLGLVGVPLFLVNGNHEQASQYLLNGTVESVPVLAGRARNRYYPLPAPDRFYSGDNEPAEFVGLRRDYYAWTWGDALFVTIDPYWHCPVQNDEGLGGNRGRGGADRRARDGWAVTMGDAQYKWLRDTLAGSRAKYKFVFSHHMLGTFRGGVEPAELFEWGGKNRQGVREFAAKRPGWDMPVHELFVKYGVTIFFQGHDHLFARQQKDGVIYQETPNPADNTYTAFNKEVYLSGDILPNSGYLRVEIAPAAVKAASAAVKAASAGVKVASAGVKVDYVRAWLPQDETPERKNGSVAFSYTVTGSGDR